MTEGVRAMGQSMSRGSWISSLGGRCRLALIGISTTTSSVQLTSLTLDGLTGAIQDKARSLHQTAAICMMFSINMWSILWLAIGDLLSVQSFMFPPCTSITLVFQVCDMGCDWVLYCSWILLSDGWVGEPLMGFRDLAFLPPCARIITTFREDGGTL